MHRHHHHHHHHRKEQQEGISFITDPGSRPKSRLDLDESLRMFNEQDLVAIATDQEKAFCKRTQHQVSN